MYKEDKLIFLFSRMHLDSNERIQAERLLKDHLEWDYIFKKSREIGASYLLYYHLKNSKFSCPVSQYLKQLKEAYYINYTLNMVMVEETKKILKVFNEEKIGAIVLKGVFLIKNIYKNIAVRSITDVDILIKKEELPKANRILNSLGFLTPTYYKDFLENSSPFSINTLVYRKNHPVRFPIHLHWHLINATWPLDFLVTKIDMERIWSKTEPTRIDGVDTLALAPEHLLIYLAQHSFHHAFDRLILSSDILEVLRHYKDRLDWELVAREAERFNLSYIAYHALLFSSQRLRFPIPQLEKLKPKESNFLEKMLSSFVCKGNANYAIAYFTYLSMQKGFLSKSRFIKKTFFPSRFVLAHNLNLDSSEINTSHYFKRITHHLSNFLTPIQRILPGRFFREK